MEIEKPHFNKIRQGGLEADVRAYAYQMSQIQVSDPVTKEVRVETRAYLWYVDMLGQSKEGLRAIWAGLVNHPPKPAVLYQDYGLPHSNRQAKEDAQEKAAEFETNHDDNETLSLAAQSETEAVQAASLWVYLAPGHEAKGWHWKYVALHNALAHQGVLLPELAYARLRIGESQSGREQSKTKEEGQTEENTTKPKAKAKKEPEKPNLSGQFLLLRLPELGEWHTSPAGLSQLYFQRLNALSPVPMLPQWGEWLWQQHLEQGLIIPLICAGCEAYLCQLPADVTLAQTIQQGLLEGQLLTPTSSSSQLLAQLTHERNLNPIQPEPETQPEPEEKEEEEEAA